MSISTGSISRGPGASSRLQRSRWCVQGPAGSATGALAFLAAGRPVITQETGFSKFLPTGKGLFGFLTMDEILAAVDVIESDYEGSCKAAREIAQEYFAAEKVLGKLMSEAGLA